MQQQNSPVLPQHVLGLCTLEEYLELFYQVQNCAKLLFSPPDYISGEDTAVRFFNAWVEQVKADIPPERLLVFEVKNGWEPLCEFLDVPVPDEPFPNVNDTAYQQSNIKSLKRFCVLSWTVMIAGLGTVVYFFKDKLPSVEIIFKY